MEGKKDIRIVYMGTPEFAVAPLRALVEGGYNIAGVVTMPDKPAGRGLKVQESAVKKYAVRQGLPVLQPEKLKSPEFLGQLRALDADLGIVVAFRMLPEEVFAMPRLGTFNLHASLLPQYRGAAPINWAIINGEARTGVTTFFLNMKMDQGALIARREVLITAEDNAGTLHDKLMETGAELVTDTVDSIIAGTCRPVDQDSLPAGGLKTAPKIFRETCRLDFTQPGKKIADLIRGLSPYPAAWADMVSRADESVRTPVKIFSAGFEAAPAIPGTTPGDIISDGNTYLKVVCEDGLIDIEELQPASKKRMNAKEYLRGVRKISAYRME